MEIIVSRQGKTTIVEPNGKIDLVGSGILGGRLADAATDEPLLLVIDLQRVNYITSAGFRVLLIAAKQATAKDFKLILCSLNEELRHLFQVAGFLHLFRVYASREESLAATA